MANFIYDLAQLIHQQKLAPVTIIAHSLGGNIALRYTGIYPENVRRIVAIEGLGPGPGQDAVSDRKPMAERMRYWIDATRALSGRHPRRYPTMEAAYARMQFARKHFPDAAADYRWAMGLRYALRVGLYSLRGRRESPQRIGASAAPLTTAARNVESTSARTAIEPQRSSRGRMSLSSRAVETAMRTSPNGFPRSLNG